MRYMERYIQKLLTMNSMVFFRFLDSSCKRFQFRLLGTLRKDTVFLLKPTQYINQTTFMSSFTQEVSQTGGLINKVLPCLKKKQPALPDSDLLSSKHLSKNLKKSTDPFKNQQTTKKRSSITDLNESNDSIDDYQMDEFNEVDDALSDEYDESKEKKKSKLLDALNGGNTGKEASINLYSYEFESIMKGHKGDQIIKYLSEQPLASPLFENPTIHAYLDAQWQAFKWDYYRIVILYLLGFIIMFPYFELFTHAMHDDGMPLGFIIRKHYVFFLMFLPVQIAISIFLTYFEVNKMIKTQDIWQAPICLYNFFQILIPMSDMYKYVFGCETPACEATLRIIQYGVNANFIIFGMIVLLYKIKYLNIASFYITRFYLVIKDTAALAAIILVTQMTFAYAYKINYSIQEKHLAYGVGIILKAFEFFKEDTYTSLWAFWQNKIIDSGENDNQSLIMFCLLVLLTAVVISTNLMLFYFLVAAVIESYNKVSQNLDNQKYLARAKILFENSLIFRRDEVYEETRYVIKAQAEKIDGLGFNKKSEAETIATEVSSSVKTSVEQESQKSDTNFKFLKNKIVKLTATQELMQQQQDQQKQDLKKILTQVQRQLGDILSRSGGGGGGGMPPPSASVAASAGAAKKKDAGKKGMMSDI